MRLDALVTVKTKMPEADFWLVRRGTPNAVGKPTREYNPEHIGIFVTRTGALDAKFIYYLLDHLHSRGHWLTKSHGTLKLVNIQTSDVKSLTFESP